MWESKKCHEKVEDDFEACWNCGTSIEGVEDPSFRKADDISPPEQPIVAETRKKSPSSVVKSPSCVVCHVNMQGLGQLPIRMGGSSGGWHLLFGEWADVSENVRPLDAYRCPQCGRLAFYDHDFSLPDA